MFDLNQLSRKIWPYAVTLCVLGSIVYFGLVKCEFLPMWDDADHVLNNPDIRSLSWQNIIGIFSSYYVGMYQPVTTLTYAIDYQMWGLSPAGFHFTNLILHLISGVMVLMLLNKITGKIKLSFLFAMVFVLHPVQVEAVAWVSARSTLLSAIFFLSALYAYISYTRSSLNIKYLLACFALFILSILSKCTAVTLPLVLILYDYLCRRKDILRMLIEKVPFIIVSIFIGLLAIDARTADSQLSELAKSFSDGDMMVVLLNSIVTYLSKIVLPINYSAYYTYPLYQMGKLPPMYFILPVLTIISIILIVWSQPKDKRKMMVFGFLFFLISLSITLKFVLVGLLLMADRYLYLPIIGVFIFLVPLFGILERQRLAKVIGYSVAAVLLGYFVFTNIQFQQYWKNEDSLFAQTIKNNPDAIPVKNMVGIRHKNKGGLKAAKIIFDEIIADYPEYGSTYNNRGNLWRSANNLEFALSDYQKGLQYVTRAVDSSAIIANIGIVYAMNHELKKAICFFSMAIILDPENKQAYFNRGNARALINDFDGANEDFKKAGGIDYEFGRAYTTVLK